MENQLALNNLEVEEIHGSNANDTLLNGQGMLRTQTHYSTAVQVIKPRNLNVIIKRCEEEAAIAGDDFYYSWSQGGEIIEGLTIGAALTIARNWGNSAVDVKVEETPNSYIFHGAFIDLETGFNIVRPFRQNKQSPKNKQGEDIYTGDRGKDIIFQIGASKAIRNVVLNAVPKWLASKVIKQAKENVIGKIEKMGIEKTRELVLRKLNALGIAIERVEIGYGKPKGWDIERLVLLMGALRSIEDGAETADSIFPIENNPQKPEEKKAEEKKPDNVDKKTGEVIPTDSPAEIPIVIGEVKADSPKKEDPKTEDVAKLEFFVERVNATPNKQALNAFLKKYNKEIKLLGKADQETLLKEIAIRESNLGDN